MPHRRARIDSQPNNSSLGNYIDFPKAFDRVSWTALWLALAQHGVSAHLIWILQELYAGQIGGVRGDDGESSRLFQISGGVRQGCVLSPRLFCCNEQWVDEDAMSTRRALTCTTTCRSC